MDVDSSVLVVESLVLFIYARSIGALGKARNVLVLKFVKNFREFNDSYPNCIS